MEDAEFLNYWRFTFPWNYPAIYSGKFSNYFFLPVGRKKFIHDGFAHPPSIHFVEDEESVATLYR